MEKAQKRIPRLPLSPGQAYAIAEARSIHQLTGEVWASKGTEWTVILPDSESHTPGVGGRVVFVRPLHQPTDLLPFISRRTQTLGLLMHRERKSLVCRDDKRQGNRPHYSTRGNASVRSPLGRYVSP